MAGGQTLAGSTGTWRVRSGRGVLSLAIGNAWVGYVPAAVGKPLTEGEAGTENKVVFIGLDDGFVEGIDLRSKDNIFSSSSSTANGVGRHGRMNDGAIDSIAFHEASSTLVTGSREGVVRVFDVRNAIGGEHALASFKRNGAGIESIAFCPPDWSSSYSSSPPPPTSSSVSDAELDISDLSLSLPPIHAYVPSFPHILLATSDGLPYRAGLTTDGGAVVVEEYVGIEGGDGVRAIRYREGDRGGGDGRVGRVGEVWMAGDDGVVRMY